MSLRTVIFFGFALGASGALAVPQIDDLVDWGVLSGDFQASRLLRDHANAHVYYYFPDRLGLTEDDEGELDFSFSYAPTGALLSFTVHPVVEKQALQVARQKLIQKDALAELRPLPLREGAYALSIRTQDGEKVVEAGQALVQNDTGSPWSVQFSFDRTNADAFVTALATGAVWGINFNYRFQAATTPSAIKVRVEKQEVIETFKKAGNQSEASLLRLFGRLKAQKAVKVFIAGQDTSLASALLLVNQYLKEKCFKAVNAAGLSAGWLYDAQKCEMGLPPEIDLVSSDRTLVSATAGMSIGGMCQKHRDLFSFSGVGGAARLGCPDRIYPDTQFPKTLADEPKELQYQPRAGLMSWEPELP
jgi:hypothetical protein